MLSYLLIFHNLFADGSINTSIFAPLLLATSIHCKFINSFGVKFMPFIYALSALAFAVSAFSLTSSSSILLSCVCFSCIITDVLFIASMTFLFGRHLFISTDITSIGKPSFLIVFSNSVLIYFSIAERTFLLDAKSYMGYSDTWSLINERNLTWILFLYQFSPNLSNKIGVLPSFIRIVA